MSLKVKLSSIPEIRDRQLRSLTIAKHLYHKDLQRQYGSLERQEQSPTAVIPVALVPEHVELLG